jgi:NAD+-dependent secondary alcohol dehydrogenase Adh1
VKAQVLREYDAAMRSPSWVSYEEVPEPRVEKPTDVLVRIGEPVSVEPTCT